MNQPVSVESLPFFAVALGFFYAFANGFRDASTVVATVVSTRALTPTIAFALCSVAEFFGTFVMGSAVAATMTQTVLVKDFVFSAHDFTRMFCVGLSVALVWGTLSWWRGWPSSNGHALLAGLIGAALAIWGPAHVRLGLAGTVFLFLLLSPLAGFFIAVAFTALLRWIGERMSSKARFMSDGCHVASCLCVAAAHGSNNGQLVIGAMIPLLGTVGVTPLANRFFIALALAAGVLVGGRRILKKLSLKFYRIRDPQGLGAEISSAATIFLCGGLGFPASTTQVVAGSIIGAGVAQNPRRVRWDFAQEMVLSWIITFPVVCLGAFLVGEALRAGGW
jgi:PiT family inorganic phosphate transporter